LLFLIVFDSTFNEGRLTPALSRRAPAVCARRSRKLSTRASGALQLKPPGSNALLGGTLPST
jgi:hypothetical protein